MVGISEMEITVIENSGAIYIIGAFLTALGVIVSACGSGAYVESNRRFFMKFGMFIAVIGLSKLFFGQSINVLISLIVKHLN